MQRWWRWRLPWRAAQCSPTVESARRSRPVVGAVPVAEVVAAEVAAGVVAAVAVAAGLGAAVPEGVVGAAGADPEVEAVAAEAQVVAVVVEVGVAREAVVRCRFLSPRRQVARQHGAPFLSFPAMSKLNDNICEQLVRAAELLRAFAEVKRSNREECSDVAASLEALVRLQGPSTRNTPIPRRKSRCPQGFS